LEDLGGRGATCKGFDLDFDYEIFKNNLLHSDSFHSFGRDFAYSFRFSDSGKL
jgi:hypothetical protein